MARNPTWTREELILALDLYLEMRLLDDRHPRVIELSQLLQRLPIHSQRTESFRNPAGVAMKLANFAALDPAYPGQSLTAGGRRDAEVWDEFARDRKRLRDEAQKIRNSRTPQYWALFASPDIYRIEEAVQALSIDNWTTKGRPVRKGDMVIVWKGKGRDPVRGVVAFAEVLTDPEIRRDTGNPFWITAEAAENEEERVDIRYLNAPLLPLWMDGSAHDEISELSIARATGGTVFYVQPHQWAQVVAAAGGLQQSDSEVEEVREAVETIAGKPGRGQGFKVDSEARRAIEDYAMKLATQHYEQYGWHVEDVSRYLSYDLRCTRTDGTELRVEVKRTTGDGSSVLITPNELRHARSETIRVALFVVSAIELRQESDGAITPNAGNIRTLDPWNIDEGTLVPVGYEYRLPVVDAEQSQHDGV